MIRAFPYAEFFHFTATEREIETILKRFPQLGAAPVLDALAFALDNPEVMDADSARESALLNRAGHARPKNPAAGRQMDLPFDQGDFEEK